MRLSTKLVSMAVVLCALLMLLLLSLCKTESIVRATTGLWNAYPPTETRRAITKGSNDFGLSVYQQLASPSSSSSSFTGAQAKGNLLFSPLSLHAVLALLFEGAWGDTAAELGTVLKLPDVKLTAKAYQAMFTHLNQLQDVSLFSAISIGVRQEKPLNETFSALAQQYFDAKVFQFDPRTADGTANTVNDWFAQKTKGALQQVVSSETFDESTAMIALNSLYFKGRWLQPFKAGATHQGTFYLGDSGETLEVEMMKGQVDAAGFLYSNTVDADILGIPYEKETILMLFVVPREKGGLTKIEDALDGISIEALVSKFDRPHKLTLTMPKFKIEKEYNMKDAMVEMGISNPFSRKASFRLVTSEKEDYNLQVDKLIQKAVIEVNEEGTTAAAATVAVMIPRSLPFNQPTSFVIDRPFIFMLLDVEGFHPQADETGIATVPPCILFLGRVIKPTQQQSVSLANEVHVS